MLAGGMALGTAMLFVSDTHLVLGLAIDLILYAAAYIVAWSVLPGGRPMLRDLRRLAVEIVHRDQKDEEV